MFIKDYRFTIEIEADPKPQSRPRFRYSPRGQPIAYKDPKQRLSDGFIQNEMLNQAPLDPFDGALAVRIIIYLDRPSGHYTKKGTLRSWAPKYPKVKPDLSNYVKGIEDCGNGILWKDDARIVNLNCWKLYADDCHPRTIISIEPLDGEIHQKPDKV